MRRLALITMLGMAAIPAPGYYHFIHYINGASVPEKFDLTALPNNTVTLFVSENGPQSYSANDGFNSVLAQIRQATLVWNAVATSSLRVAFGGLENIATPQNTPGIDVVFEDLPPGLYGFGGPTSTLNPAAAADGKTFIPVVRSTMHLNVNMTVLPGPSYNETFFMTAVHEIGHTLGLQHTFTSATMSQATTRATNLTHALAPDDIAGISVLYPASNLAQFGSITGTITVGGQGVHLASVVAIQPGAGALSGVTNPDGTFRIDGVPPGQYLVYVHTMPPDANIYGPWNADGSLAPPTGPITTLFYPGTANVTQASSISVQAGAVTPSINIAVASLPAVSLYDDVLYSWFDDYTVGPVQPASVDILTGPTTVVASGYGLGSNGQAPGLNVQTIGGSVAIGDLLPYQSDGYTYVAMNLSFAQGAQTGWQHVVFSTPGNLYVLPSGINLTTAPPPTVTSATSNPDGSVTITGTTWAPDTLLYFDGLPSTIATLNATNGVAVVQPPPGAGGQQAILTAYNSDGQNSQYVQSASPATYTYGASATPAITSIAPASLPAGAEASIEITGTGFTLTPGVTSVGFGTSDIAVQNVFVLSSNQLVADVLVSPNAALSTPDVSVIAGFQVATAPAAFQITSAVPALPEPFPSLQNAITGLIGAYPGAIVSLYGANLATPGSNPVVTVAGQPVTVLYASPNQLNLQLPGTLTPGLATLTLNNGVSAGYPVTVNIDSLPAAIGAVQDASGAYVTATQAAYLGDMLIVSLTNLAPAGTNITPGQIQVSIGGVPQSVVQVNAFGSLYQVGFNLNSNAPVGQAEQLVVYYNGRSSYPAMIPIAYPNGSFVSSN